MVRMFAAAFLVGSVAAAAVAAPAAKRDESEKAADNKDKIICKRFVETGSLVKSNRICKSKRDWERGRDDLRAQSGSGFGSTCGRSGTGPSC